MKIASLPQAPPRKKVEPKKKGWSPSNSEKALIGLAGVSAAGAGLKALNNHLKKKQKIKESEGKEG